MLALVAVLVLPVAATAGKREHFVIPANRTSEFHLKATNGYVVSVSASQGEVWLTASKGSEAQVSYFVHGVTSGGRIEASFGNLGSIAVHFRPSGPLRRHAPEDGCRGGGENVQRGTFVGKIGFEGEQAYTTLSASRARGEKTESFKRICSEGGETGNSHSPMRLTSLLAHADSGRALFAALKVVSKAHPALDGSIFSASIFERKRHLTIFRTVGALAGVDAFTVTASNKTPVLATVSPPAPFSGTATYEKAQGSSSSWAGSLSASVPGLGIVPLADSDWTAALNPKNTGAASIFTVHRGIRQRVTPRS